MPLTEVDLTIGSRRITGRVDAHCSVDPKATRGNTRFYYNVSYPWFGYHPPADQPQWQLGLSIRPGSLPAGASNELTFSFQDSTPDRSAYVQTVAFAKRSGTGTVRVTRHGAGARFEFEGRTERGQRVRASIDCSEFQDGEAAVG